ncbi:large conductance mechanosensitive channel [Novosphingobium sp. PhB165]|uniref:large conductance mechanosensitive channel protein MscL n=1 Tax=Novosphingobium sp. PhB165 TaxID=2485105 RepID=UPI00105168F7|nr:large conductance mechanosensitive channel protein MscL [Novosphingobium sp. PhB165]TCM14993.1 large conductance mechanosensitive channel [Novosphingobium sp. PhB165]
MLQEFKTFIARGNALDLAVGVIIGAAFGKIVSSLTDDVIMPFIGLITGGIDFSNKFVVLGTVPATYHGPMTYAALKTAGVAMLGYGSFITAVLNFLILAFVIFLLVRQANKLMPAKEAAPAGPTEVELLAEIRDSLKKG